MCKKGALPLVFIYVFYSETVDVVGENRVRIKGARLLRPQAVSAIFLKYAIKIILERENCDQVACWPLVCGTGRQLMFS